MLIKLTPVGAQTMTPTSTASSSSSSACVRTSEIKLGYSVSFGGIFFGPFSFSVSLLNFSFTLSRKRVEMEQQQMQKWTIIWGGINPSHLLMWVFRVHDKIDKCWTFRPTYNIQQSISRIWKNLTRLNLLLVVWFYALLIFQMPDQKRLLLQKWTKDAQKY